ncbi:hypothetical protein N7448_004314 [Penicillium atrosanguineum]|uniref:Uncharacterized protein n=1 Tax=Penicillium atrosanguineum TaxID=1132637 RepID=A0A9W9Q104_9EURO|nr:uncharacterized protein N7443_003278 [Penicillium atrosanguineum]KAJ5118039.1 hypothetical protein N7526_011062 [Penicillium atrosanguineum]KAJ5140906.1 hypothetical protein N7448_004314 [Penicillium atrosanguineum]KAJ5310817.1 hypothetical protein N7443_003278 [Penicillium atrosanguineum]KAJ5316342.1 hypothetical protein N7476_006649 [Penicillium atrosanguineum]
MPSPSQYIFGLQAAPLLASGVFTMIWPESLPDPAFAGLSNGTIHAIGGGEWAKVAPFEAVMGLLTAAGLYWDWTLKRSKSKRE